MLDLTARQKIDLLKDTIRNPFAWPGGFAKVGLMIDGCPICVKCLKSEYRNILDSTRNTYHDGWAFEMLFINWEDPDCYCAHCGEKIPGEYCES